MYWNPQKNSVSHELNFPSHAAVRCWCAWGTASGGEGAACCRWPRGVNLIFNGCYFLNPVNFPIVFWGFFCWCGFFLLFWGLVFFWKESVSLGVCRAGKQLILALGFCAIAACAGMEGSLRRSHMPAGRRPGQSDRSLRKHYQLQMQPGLPE